MEELRRRFDRVASLLERFLDTLNESYQSYSGLINLFVVFASALNGLAIASWITGNKELSRSALSATIVFILLLILFTSFVIVRTAVKYVRKQKERPIMEEVLGHSLLSEASLRGVEASHAASHTSA